MPTPEEHARLVAAGMSKLKAKPFVKTDMELLVDKMLDVQGAATLQIKAIWDADPDKHIENLRKISADILFQHFDKWDRQELAKMLAATVANHLINMV